MKLNEPLGNPLWGAFFVRMTLGSYLLLAGWTKLDSIPAFVRDVQRLNLMPPHLAALYAISLPYLEVAVGALLLIGIWTTLSAVLAAVIVGSFLLAFGVFPSPNRLLFNKDIVLFAAAVSLMFSGAGAISLDRFRKAG